MCAKNFSSLLYMSYTVANGPSALSTQAHRDSTLLCQVLQAHWINQLNILALRDKLVIHLRMYDSSVLSDTRMPFIN